MVYCVGGGHDEGPEVFSLEDDHVVIVLLALVMVIASGQEISLFVEDTRFVS